MSKYENISFTKFQNFIRIHNWYFIFHHFSYAFWFCYWAIQTRVLNEKNILEVPPPLTQKKIGVFRKARIGFPNIVLIFSVPYELIKQSNQMSCKNNMISVTPSDWNTPLIHLQTWFEVKYKFCVNYCQGFLTSQPCVIFLSLLPLNKKDSKFT